jgi:hypothetical protein
MCIGGEARTGPSAPPYPPTLVARLVVSVGPMKSGPATVALIGFIAGSLDIAAAFVQFFLATGKSPVRVLRYIASGIFGRAAYAEGPLMPALGLALHYAFATAFAAIFFVAYPRVPALRRQPAVAGLLYAVPVWVVMNLVVLPLSQAQRGPLELGSVALAIVILMLAIGLPISLATHRHYTARR